MIGAAVAVSCHFPPDVLSLSCAILLLCFFHCNVVFCMYGLQRITKECCRGAVFVSTLVLGIVIMIQDVKLARRPFVRDLIVLLLVRP